MKLSLHWMLVSICLLAISIWSLLHYSGHQHSHAPSAADSSSNVRLYSTSAQLHSPNKQQKQSNLFQPVRKDPFPSTTAVTTNNAAISSSSSSTTTAKEEEPAAEEEAPLFPDSSTWQPPLVKAHNSALPVFLLPDRTKAAFSAELNFSSPPLSPPTSQHSLTEGKHPIRIAYIFAGSTRSFQCPKVHWSLRFNVIDAFGGDPFVFVRMSTEDNENTRTGKGKLFTPRYTNQEVEEALKVLNPVAVKYFSLSTQLAEMRKHHTSSLHRVYQEHDLRRYSMYFHRSMGYRMVRKYETEHHFRFDWVVLIRLDAAWLEPLPPIQYFAPDRVWVTETGFTMLNDQFMLVPRKYSDYMFNLDTKVQTGVYCLGGPDMEAWKCNATELQQRGYSAQTRADTLSACCPWNPNRDMYLQYGYSEVIHMRHLLFGAVPISLARLPVFLTRYLSTGECYADCSRLHYHFKNYAMNEFQHEYPYWGDMHVLDTRHVSIAITDASKCALINHKDFAWQPKKAVELHALMASQQLPQIDYRTNLYAQWDKLHPSIQLNPHSYRVWRIHPSRHTAGCLTFNYRNVSLTWEACETHLRNRGGVSFSPNQAFHVLVQPPDSSWLRYPFVSAQDTVFSYETLPLQNVTMIRMFERQPQFLNLRYKVFCMTVVKAALNGKLTVLMQECRGQDFSEVSQLFYTVQGGGLGSHGVGSTVGLLRSVQYPEYCVARDGNREDGLMEAVVLSEKLTLERCRPKVEVPGRQFFEFELLP